jgi:hypothetical protein
MAARSHHNLCELIHSSLLPDKSQDGSRCFRDFARDEQIMAKIFEGFVRNFAIRHLPATKISAMHIDWCASDHAEGMLLYPSNGYCFDHIFTLHSRHRIRVSTIDLQQSWRNIEINLMELFRMTKP